MLGAGCCLVCWGWWVAASAGIPLGIFGVGWLMLAPCQVKPSVQQPAAEAPDTRLLRSRWVLLCCWLLVACPRFTVRIEPCQVLHPGDVCQGHDPDAWPGAVPSWCGCSGFRWSLPLSVVVVVFVSACGVLRGQSGWLDGCVPVVCV